MRGILKIVFYVFLMALGAFVYHSIRQQFFTEKIQDSGSVLLERLKEVLKVVAIESEMSEMYQYENYSGLELNVFRKKAMVRVQARIAYGYDFSNFQIQMDQKSKSITLPALPPPKILSMECRPDYYNLEEGIFVNFTTEDLNRIQQRSQELILRRFPEQESRKRAQEKMQSLLKVFETLCTDMGYQFRIQEGIHLYGIEQYPGFHRVKD